MKKIVFIVAALTIVTAASAQTKKVAHRSHSGTNKTFTAHGNDNFGLATPVEEPKKVDSSKVKNNNTGTDKNATKPKSSKRKASKSKKYSGSTK